MTVTREQLKAIMPGITKYRIDRFIEPLNAWMFIYSIETPARIAAFLAQIAQESGSLYYVEEIASGEAYEGRRDLGNTRPGDGVKYKGRGLIQITGRSNYQRVANAFDMQEIMDNPALLESPNMATRSAAWYWYDRNLNEIADAPDTQTFYWTRTKKRYNKFQWITILINGGLTHYNERLAFYQRALKVLNP